jgi:hypothetical protein
MVFPWKTEHPAFSGMSNRTGLGGLPLQVPTGDPGWLHAGSMAREQKPRGDQAGYSQCSSAPSPNLFKTTNVDS